MKHITLTTLIIITSLSVMGQSKPSVIIIKDGQTHSSIDIALDTSYRVVDTIYSVSQGGYECFRSIKSTCKMIKGKYQITQKDKYNGKGYWEFYSIAFDPYIEPNIFSGFGQPYLLTPNTFR